MGSIIRIRGVGVVGDGKGNVILKQIVVGLIRARAVVDRTKQVVVVVAESSFSHHERIHEIGCLVVRCVVVVVVVVVVVRHGYVL